MRVISCEWREIYDNTWALVVWQSKIASVGLVGNKWYDSDHMGKDQGHESCDLAMKAVETRLGVSTIDKWEGYSDLRLTQAQEEKLHA